MNSTPRHRGLLRRRSLGLRITLSFVAAAILMTTILSAATLFTVRRLVEDQRVRSSVRQTLFAVLFAREFIADDNDPEQLVSRLQIRQSFDAMVTSGPEWYSTGLDLTPEVVPPGLHQLVRQERIGYQISHIRSQRWLVFGTPLPPRGTDLYLFFPLEDIDRTLSIVTRALTVIGLAVVAAMAFLARRLSAGILQPLAAVSGAAQAMAEGLLETRVETGSSDELGQLAGSFNRMGAALRDIIQHERDFVAAVSHELRTPLAAANAAVSVVSTYEDRLPDDGKEALALVREDLLALRKLVTELLEVSELDSGRAMIRNESIDVRRFIEALVQRKRREIDVSGDDVTITTDMTRLERIVGNLVDNAFSHGDGRDVRVRTSDDGEWCVIAVSDAGPGISPEEIPMLFRRFFKTDRSRSRDRGGVGLGLAIARENAELLGGTITVTSSRGHGATFTVRIPKGSR